MSNKEDTPQQYSYKVKNSEKYSYKNLKASKYSFLERKTRLKAAVKFGLYTNYAQ
mgnify:CR=1 FL=1